MQTAIVTGVTGQIGSYFAELLLEKDYRVIGIKRRCSTNNMWRVDHLLNNENFSVVEGDITDSHSVSGIISTYRPHLFVNFAAQSHVGSSFKQPYSTFEIDAVGVLNILESIRTLSPHTKFYQSSTSEMWGSNYSTKRVWNGLIPAYDKNDVANEDDYTKEERYQDEDTPLSPNSPYAVAKVAAHHLVKIYRDAYGLFACSGILNNTESPRRGEEFVTRKITKWIGEFKQFESNLPKDIELFNTDSDNILFFGFGESVEFSKLKLGNIESFRAFLHVKDSINAIYLMLQNDSPRDYVISADETHSIKDFIQVAFNHVGLKWEDYVIIDKDLYRPMDVPYLNGKADKIKKELGWKQTISFTDLVHEMVDTDIEKAKKKNTEKIH